MALIAWAERMSKRNYCRYRSNKHDTNKRNALKDDIEDLIQKGKLTQYVKKPEIKEEIYLTEKT